MKNLLFIGASGLIGTSFLDRYKKKYNIVYTHNKNRFKKSIKFDVKKNKISYLMKKCNPLNTVIYAPSISNHSNVFKNQKISNLINVKCNINQLKQLRGLKCKLIFLSTQMVYNGKKGYYKETDLTKPILLYAKQKLEIENYIKNNINNYLILRLSKVIGIKKDKKDPINNFIKQIKKDNSYKLATDQYSNFLYIDDLIKILEIGIEKNITGIFNVGGNLRASRFDFYTQILKQNKIKKFNHKIKKCEMDDLNFQEKQPKDTSLNINKLKKIFGYTPKSYINFLKEIKLS
jgi:dTDP-4-dehydrorhamnose reductase